MGQAGVILVCEGPTASSWCQYRGWGGQYRGWGVPTGPVWTSRYREGLDVCHSAAEPPQCGADRVCSRSSTHLLEEQGREPLLWEAPDLFTTPSIP